MHGPLDTLYISFDNITTAAAAASSPYGFLKEYEGPVILDEIRIVPEIFRALKMRVDELRWKGSESINGRYLLTGSVNIMALPRLSDSLVGRMSIKTLYPLSVSEVLDGEGNFVATELLKTLSFSNGREQLLHFRTSDNKAVDFVLERPDGSLAAIEVKTSDTITPSDFKGLKVLQSVAPNDFKCGVVLYSGKDVVPFGDSLYAVPIDRLWH